MSNVSINSNIVMSGLKIYSINGEIYAEVVGEALTDIGPVNFNVKRVKLDFNSPGQTELGAYAFMDGRGRVGYDFHFGDVLYQIQNNDAEKNDGATENNSENNNVEASNTQQDNSKDE